MTQYLYTSQLLHAFTGAALDNQSFIFQFTTPAVLPDNLSYIQASQRPAINVDIIDWSAVAGPYHALTLNSLLVKTNAIGDITGWYLNISAVIPDYPLFIATSLAPYSETNWICVIQQGCFAGEFVQATFGQQFTGTTFESIVIDAAISMQPGFWTMSPGVPEPATWAMMLIGFAAVALIFRNRTRVGCS